MIITNVQAREIFDCRGLPTLECQIVLEDERSVTASVPSGISVGSHEAKQKRDNDDRMRGYGVEKSIEIIEKIIAPTLIGNEPDVVALDQMMIELDGTEDKSNFGANTLLVVSMAITRAQALSNDMQLYELIASLCTSEAVKMPFPIVNMLGGGAHAQTGLRIQEFLIIPVKAQHFRQAFEQSVEFFHILGDVIIDHKLNSIIGIEGGYAPILKNDHQALDLLTEAINRTSDGSLFKIGIDVAATQFYDAKLETYCWHGKNLKSDDLISVYESLIEKYPIVSIEDGLVEDDWKGWLSMMERFGENVQLVGDDLFATNPGRIWYGAHQGAANAAIIKPNQIGTITETIQAIELCHEHALNIVVSHRSGETTDSFIADLAVGASAEQIKAGGCARGERLAKYNRLLQIEDNLVLSMFEG